MREELAKTSCPYCGAPAKKDLLLWEALAVVFYTCGRQGRLEKDEPYNAGERYDGLFLCLGNQAKAAHEELARKDAEIAFLKASVEDYKQQLVKRDSDDAIENQRLRAALERCRRMLNSPDYSNAETDRVCADALEGKER